MGLEFAQQLITAGTIALNTSFWGGDLPNAGFNDVNDTKVPSIGLEFEGAAGITQGECAERVAIESELHATEILLGPDENGNDPETPGVPDGCEDFSRESIGLRPLTPGM